MRLPWFNRIGMFYTPVSFMGWVILIASLFMAVYLFLDVDSRSHSASDTLMNWAFRLLILAVVYWLVGFFSSRRR